MYRLSVFPRLLAALGCVVSLAGCAATNPDMSATADAGAVLAASDVDRLTGEPWNGTLTYLNYESESKSTIKSSLLVIRLPARPDGGSAWDMRVGYSDEPEANSGETAVLAKGGEVFRDSQVLDRSVLPDGSVRIVTEQDGQDDNRDARIRFVYLLGEEQCSIQKLVRFTPGDEFFERHIYQWSR